MITIVFEAHGTTFDNENKVASGWFDTRLSPLGVEQAKELGKRYNRDELAAIFCSDLKRAYQTATIAFDYDPRNIFMDWRLRECDYGQYTQSPSEEVEKEKLKHLEIPFVDGESYVQVMDRMASFISDLKIYWEGKKVMIIGHRGTHYALEHFINNKPLEACVGEVFKWQPGWQYELK